MKEIWKYIRKHWTRVWLIAVLIVSVSMVFTYAAYTEVFVVKRVVSTREPEGELFSSNCMKYETSSRMIMTRQFPVTVCNFDQVKNLTYSPAWITYNFYAELQVKIGSEYYNMPELYQKLVGDYPGDLTTAEEKYQEYVDKIANNYSICKVEDDNSEISSEDEADHYFTSTDYKVSFGEQTLAPNRSSTDKFRVTVASTDLGKLDPDFYVHVWAEKRISGDSWYTIQSRIYGAAGTKNASSWQGALRETNCATVDYDFYNYVITGSGKGEVDILWNDAYFEINDFFFSSLSGNKFKNNSTSAVEIVAGDAKYGSSFENGKYVGWQKITIMVDSSTDTDKSRYELQLYKVKENTAYIDKSGSGGVDEKASNFITCFFTAGTGN